MSAKRYSRQRELIYRCLMDTDQHPTAEMIYSWLKPENPNLSLGTVYRNLNLLADEGIIVRMPFSVERYDANVERHAHFRCKQCGGVYDLMDTDYDPHLDEEAEKYSGHKIEYHTVVFVGTCTKCIENIDFKAKL